MKELDLSEMDDRNEAFAVVEETADDEYCGMAGMYGVFFFGKLINDPDNSIFLNKNELLDETKTYCTCHACQKVFSIGGGTDLYKEEPKSGDGFECPYCGAGGMFADFRDRNYPVDNYLEQDYAWLEIYNEGYCLRLFKAFLDYSDREYDNYTKLDCYAQLRIFEFAREYLHEGNVRYFINQNEDSDSPKWKEIDGAELDDDMFYLINSSADDNFYVCDIKDALDALGRPLMDAVSNKIPYKTFCTLRRYGFDVLREELYYSPADFVDSSKISEVLGADYNQIIANTGKGIGLEELKAARGLYKLNIIPSLQNISLFMQMDNIPNCDRFSLTSDNARKIFKYLRNQQGKAKSSFKDHTGRDYADYINECVRLAYDMTDERVLFPTDLNKAHRNTSKLVKIAFNLETDTAIKCIYDRYHAFCEFTDRDMCVVMPKGFNDIANEGKAQSHCVETYAERVAKGQDIILFIRKVKEKDKPYFTMEIKPIMQALDIVQVRGYKNSNPPPEVELFLEKYRGWFNHRRADIVDSLTRIFYKAVKKVNGKFISAWDNKTEYIPGQVLETDTDKNPDKVAVRGIHIASLEFAQNYGDTWENVAILELEVQIRDIVIPDAKDQLRASKVKVLREVPLDEMGEWGKRHQKTVEAA